MAEVHHYQCDLRELKFAEKKIRNQKIVFIILKNAKKYLLLVCIAHVFLTANIVLGDITDQLNPVGADRDIDHTASGDETPGISETSGFLWGGYVSPASNNRISFIVGQSAIGLRHIPGQGSYVYTIFDPDGTAPFTAESVALSDIEVNFKIGRDAMYQLMVRRASDGVWLLGPQLGPAPPLAGIQTFDLSGTWTEVDTATNNNLNLLAAGDEIPLVLTATTGNFSTLVPTGEIDGGGLYLSATPSSSVQMDSFTWHELIPVATWPLQTGFEAPDYTPGSLNLQQGWQAEGIADIQTTSVYSGSQAVCIGSDSDASYAPSNVIEDVILHEFWIKSDGDEIYYALPVETSVTCVISVHATSGIIVLDGTGDGCGDWIETGHDALLWTKIGVRQNYNKNTWDLFIDGEKILNNLGNAWHLESLHSLDFNGGTTSPLYLDELSSVASFEPQEIRVADLQNNSAIVENGSTIDLGLVALDSLPLTRTLVVSNIGGDDLLTSSPQLSQGLVLTDGLQPVIEFHTPDSFIVEFTINTIGFIDETVSIANNDLNNSPYIINLIGEISDMSILPLTVEYWSIY